MSAPHISAAELKRLEGLWQCARAWVYAANGFNSAYDQPITRPMARDAARVSLDDYFEAIEQLINRKALPAP